jgi:histidinol-phosphatase (PHP family)
MAVSTMIKANFHTHTKWCDGKDTAESMVLAAIERGFTDIGFSPHMAFPLAHEWELSPEEARSYVDEIRALREKYAGDINVWCGGEADYIRGFTDPDRSRYRHLGLDYLIGSVHTVISPDGRELHVDASPASLTEGLREIFGGDARLFVQSYFEQQREMLKYDFDVVAHPDLVRKFNLKHPYFDESASWYLEELEKTASAIAASGKIVEVNTGAISRGWLDDAYPSEPFRAMLRRCGVKFILSSDSHAASTIDCAFDRFGDAEVFERYPRSAFPYAN